jgi:hypothetical protein
MDVVFTHCAGLDVQSASEHYLHRWGIKPTVLSQCNPLDLHPLTLAH